MPYGTLLGLSKTDEDTQKTRKIKLIPAQVKSVRFVNDS